MLSLVGGRPTPLKNMSSSVGIIIQILYHINSVKKIWSFPVQAPHHRPRRLAPPSAVWFPARCQNPPGGAMGEGFSPSTGG